MRTFPLLLGLLLAMGALVLPAEANHGPSEKTFHKVPSVGGHEVPITVYRPIPASANFQMPIVLHSHGWSGSRITGDGAFQDIIAAGIGVVSVDMRGHGEARTTSEARVHHMDYEIEDVRAVLTYMADAARFPWVLLDGPGDPRAGALGGSYGGGYQLLTAAVDDRLDVLVPEITWNDLPQSLAPNGGIKSAWVDVLYGAGNAFARVHPDIHQGFAVAAATNGFPDGSVPGTPDLVSQFTRSSPASYPLTIDVPTFLIQGMPDTLFNLNQAAANFAQISATGAPTKLVTHLGGHILNTNGTLGGQPIDAGLQPPAGPSPCGDPLELTVVWLLKHLKSLDVDTGPRVCIALDDETVVTGDDFPLPGTTVNRHALPDAPSVLLGVPDRKDVLVLTASEEMVLAGIPVLYGDVTSMGDYTVYWSLVVEDADGRRTLGSQITPLRGGPSGEEPFTIALGGVGARLLPGDELYLSLSSHELQFGQNSERTVGPVGFVYLELDLPEL